MGIGLLPGFPLPVFVAMAVMLAGLGLFMQRQAAAARDAEALSSETAQNAAAETARDDIAETLRLDDLRLELGAALVPLISASEAALPGKIKSLRQMFARDYGFVIPAVRIKDEPALPANAYAIMVQGVQAARGEVRPRAMMVLNPAEAPMPLPGERMKDPTFGLDAVWVEADIAAEAERLGCTVVDPESVVITHLTEVIKQHMPELLTYGATQALIEGLAREYQKLVGEISTSAPAIMVQHVLQALLTERVSIRNLPLIVEAIAEASRGSANVTTITEHVRRRLSNQICQSMTDETGFVSVITMSADWEAEFNAAVRITGDERNFLMSPQRVQEFVLEARKEIQSFAGRDEWPALLVSPEVRSFVRAMLERVSPMTQVISHNEVHRKASLRTVATIGG